MTTSKDINIAGPKKGEHINSSASNEYKESIKEWISQNVIHQQHRLVGKLSGEASVEAMARCRNSWQ